MMAPTWGWTIQPCRDGETFLLAEPYHHDLQITPGRHRLPDVEAALTKYAGVYRVTIDAGFEFDGASIPKLFWNIAPPMTGRHTHASLLHDWLYATHKIQVLDEDGEFETRVCERELADLVFLQVMQEDGVRKDLRETMWGAVRNHGRGAWSD